MSDTIVALLRTQPEFLYLGILVLLMLVVGLRFLLAKFSTRRRGVNWAKDPNEMRDLSPALKRARLMMSVTAGMMICLFFLAILTIFTGG